MPSLIKNRLARFARADDGNITIEAVIIFPLLILLFCASWVYFDVMRQQSVNQKANYTIGDALSRETDKVDETYIDNAYNLLLHLTKSQSPATDLRITVVTYRNRGNSGNGEYKIVWSRARGDFAELTNADLANMTDRLPIMASGDQMILVETRDWYDPIFDAGLAAFDIKTYSFTRPRFAPQVIFLGENDRVREDNGWGNGDDEAPGNSLCHNNAENQTDCAS
ncbi:hypothetical protein KUH32_11035 [Thalassococcus sp. CAU 1522]|uniref:Flp pilus assembly protein TadG n=1 Tax=Thalassococcus arenae TaxID=2851652 RepID=A0ABS6N8J4_9RHOB|nr:hypothetical protein [Thalassococcus arenae]MBV2360312.1 hypothetical protein [Thalassococcus arenae]